VVDFVFAEYLDAFNASKNKLKIELTTSKTSVEYASYRSDPDDGHGE
jgi:hypothetical protein